MTADLQKRRALEMFNCSLVLFKLMTKIMIKIKPFKRIKIGHKR